MMAEINHSNSPKATIRWDLAADRTKTLVMTLEDFLLCAFTTDSEEAFRAKLWTMGTLESKSRAELLKLRKPLIVHQGIRETPTEVTEAQASYARAAKAK